MNKRIEHETLSEYHLRLKANKMRIKNYLKGVFLTGKHAGRLVWNPKIRLRPRVVKGNKVFQDGKWIEKASVI